jgi:hypothetical protein
MNALVGKDINSFKGQELYQKTTPEKGVKSPYLDKVATIARDSLKTPTIEKGLSQSNKESIIKESVRNLRGKSSSGVSQVNKVFADLFLSKNVSLVLGNQTSSSGVQWLDSFHDIDSPLLAFFRKLGLITKANKVDSSFSTGENNQLLEESLDILREFLKNEARWSIGIDFAYDDLSKLNEQLIEVSYRKFADFLRCALERNPEDELMLQLGIVVSGDRSTHEKIKQCKELFKGQNEHVLFDILDHIFLGTSLVSAKRFEEFGEMSPLLKTLGIRYDESAPILSQSRIRNAFFRQVNKIIYSQYKAKIQELSHNDLLRLDIRLKLDNPGITAEELLQKTKKHVVGLSSEGMREINDILEGKSSLGIIEKFIDDLHQEVLFPICQIKEGVLLSCYEKFAQVHFFNSCIYKSTLEEISKVGLHPIYREFARASYLDSSNSSLKWIVNTVMYQSYQNHLKQLGNTSLKDELIKRDKELNDLGLDIEMKVQRTRFILSQKEFASLAPLLLPTLHSNFKIGNLPKFISKGLVPKNSQESRERLDRFARDVLHKDTATTPDHNTAWEAIKTYLSREKESPFWHFLESRGFFEENTQADSLFNRLLKLNVYEDLFKGFLHGLTSSFKPQSLSEVNDFAKEFALDAMIKHLKELTPTLKDTVHEEFYKIKNDQNLSINEKIFQSQSLLKTLNHRESPVLKSLLSGSFIGATGFESLFAFPKFKKSDWVFPAIFREIGVVNQSELSLDDNYFERLDFIEDLKNFIHAFAKVDQKLADELASIEIEDLPSLERVFQTVINRYILPHTGSKSKAIDFLVNEIRLKMNERMSWLSSRALEFDLLDLRTKLLNTSTLFEKNRALRKGFYLLQEKLKIEITDRKANPVFIEFVEECCLDQNTGVLDNLITEIKRSERSK